MQEKTKEWLRTYYPLKAEMVEPAAAAAHSLQKWRGLRPEVLEQHGLDRGFLYATSVVEQATAAPVLFVDGDSCALCKIHYDHNGATREARCAACPLMQLLGRPCDQGEDSPYNIWLDKADPEPMITALKAVVQEQAQNDASVAAA